MAVELGPREGAALHVTYDGAASLRAVGALLYEMLAGGPAWRERKDDPRTAPRPLGKLRAFLGGGPIPPDLETFVHDLVMERFASAERALDALDALRID